MHFDSLRLNQDTVEKTGCDVRIKKNAFLVLFGADEVWFPSDHAKGSCNNGLIILPHLQQFSLIKASM